MANDAKVSILVQIKDAATAGLNQVKAGFGELKSVLGSLQAQLAAFGVALGLGEAVRYIIGVNTEMQTLRARLDAFADSAREGGDWFARLHDLAKNSIFTIKQVSDAFLTLRAAGITPTSEQMQGFINHATALGVSIEQVAGDVSAAINGYYRSLRDLNVHVVDQGATLAVTFHGHTEQIGKDAQSILAYLGQIEQKQFATATAKQLSTIAGATKQLKDALEVLAVRIGEAGLNKDLINLTHAITTFVNDGGATKFVQWIEDVAFFFAQAGRGLMAAVKGLETLLGLAKDLVTLNWDDAKKRMTELGDTMLKLAEEEGKHQMEIIARGIEARNRLAAGQPARGGNEMPGTGGPHALLGFPEQVQAAHAQERIEAARALAPAVAEAMGVIDALSKAQLDQMVGIATGDIARLAGDIADSFNNVTTGIMNAVDASGVLQQNIADIAQLATGTFMDSFESAFTAIGAGQTTLANGLKKIMGQTIGAIAQAEGKYYVAKGVAAIAKGIETKDPSMFLAAAKYFAASALFFALGGAAGSAGQGGGGGGGGSAVTNTNNLAGQQPPATLILQGGASIDTNNPDHLDALANALAALSGRRIVIKAG